MGLFYLMPVSSEEVDYVNTSLGPQGEQIQVKSYGPPILFWYYLAAILLVLIIMTMAIWAPMNAMIQGEDVINRILGMIVLTTLFTTPAVIIAFYYYQKKITRTQDQLQIGHFIFGLKVAGMSLPLSQLQLSIQHELGGENYARLSGNKDLRAFYNQGHFYLYAMLSNNKIIMIDRGQRRADLEKLVDLLKLNSHLASSLDKKDL